MDQDSYCRIYGTKEEPKGEILSIQDLMKQADADEDDEDEDDDWDDEDDFEMKLAVMLSPQMRLHRCEPV